MPETKPLIDAVYFDLDGVIFNRGPETDLLSGVWAYYGLLYARLRNNQTYGYTRDTLPQLDRTVRTGKPKAKLSLARHAFREVNPGAPELMSDLHAAQVDININTGRPNTGEWVKITERALTKRGLDNHIKDKYFKPVGIPGPISKADAVRNSPRLDKTIHVDDDIRVIECLRELYPELILYLFSFQLHDVWYKSLNVSDWPNVTVIRSLGEFNKSLHTRNLI